MGNNVCAGQETETYTDEAGDAWMDARQLNEEGRDLWNRKARFWDKLHGDEGNLFHRRLIEPSLMQLLELRSGESLLDIGCGNGALARSLAKQGAKVTAIDFSEEMIKLAKARNADASTDIRYHVVDATDELALAALGPAQYDAITCTMTLMDIPTIQPLFSAARQLLRADGRFVISSAHPAFNSNNPIFVQEKEDLDGVVSERFAVKIRHYLELPPVKGSGAPNESTPHYYYHRSLSQLLGAAFAAGFVMDGIVEPAFTPEDAAISERLSWYKLWQIPPVLSARLRPR